MYVGEVIVRVVVRGAVVVVVVRGAVVVVVMRVAVVVVVVTGVVVVVVVTGIVGEVVVRGVVVVMDVVVFRDVVGSPYIVTIINSTTAAIITQEISFCFTILVSLFFLT